MDARTIDWRAQRGLRLLKDKGDSIQRIVDDKFLVPSESGTGSYLVDITTTTERCSCPDWKTRAAGASPEDGASPPATQVRCKHIWSVLIHERREVVTEAGTVTFERRTRMDWTWTKYRQARCEEKALVWQLGSELCSMVASPAYAGTGRYAFRRGDVLFAGLVRGYQSLAQDRCTSDLKEAERDGLITRAPHYNTVYSTLGLPSAHDDLRWLLRQSTRPFQAIEHDFAVDSTGISRNLYLRWVDHKWGKEKKERKTKQFMKVSVAVGVLTKAIGAIDVSTGNRHDGPFLRDSLLPQLVENFDDIQTILGDAAYSSRKNRRAVVEAGAKPVIDFAYNATYGKDPIWNQCLGECRLKREQWLSVYGDRNIVESFFSSYKRVFGTSVRAKTDDGAFAEILCRALAHNLRMVAQCMFMLGIKPRFTPPPQPPMVLQ